MALTREDLYERSQGAVVLQFPVGPARARARRQLQLERRRRTALVVLTLVSLGALWHMPPDVAASDAPSADSASVEVRPGDTLWEIATTHAPEGTDPRDYIGEIQRANGLDGAPQVGDTLRLPR